jgi:hypothetical protein|tara:strand:- start:1757 stop:2431 length:675 start_codon:yes stop_codon:yes gene_type:complete
MQTVLDLDQYEICLSMMHSVADACEESYADRNEFTYAPGLYDVSQIEDEAERFARADDNIRLLLHTYVTQENECNFNKLVTNNELVLDLLCIIGGSEQGVIGALFEGATWGLYEDKTRRVIKGKTEPQTFEENMAQAIWGIWKDDVRDHLLDRDSLRREVFQLAMAEKIAELNFLKDRLALLQKEHKKSQTLIGRLLGTLKSKDNEIETLKDRIVILESEIQAA